jgi:hypothetical protein
MVSMKIDKMTSNNNQHISHESDLPSRLAKHALRALNGAGIWYLEQITAFSENEIKQLHGIGPNALNPLHTTLTDSGLSFKDEATFN